MASPKGFKNTTETSRHNDNMLLICRLISEIDSSVDFLSEILYNKIKCMDNDIKISAEMYQWYHKYESETKLKAEREKALSKLTEYEKSILGL